MNYKISFYPKTIAPYNNPPPEIIASTSLIYAHLRNLLKFQFSSLIYAIYAFTHLRIYFVHLRNPCVILLIYHQIFLLARDWSKYVTGPNIPPPLPPIFIVYCLSSDW